MAEENDSQDDKTEEPSQHRIDEFRKRGEVASSKELTSVLLLSACILATILSMTYIFEVMSEYITWILTLDVEKAFQDKEFKKLVEYTAETGLMCAGPILLVALLISIVSNLIQFGPLWAPEVLEFKPERINPIQGLKKIFSMRSIVEAIKGIFKFSIIIGIVYYFMRDNLNLLNGFLQNEFINSFVEGKEIIMKLSFLIILGMVVVAVADFGYQKYSYNKKLRQTKEQAKREQKEQDGNPEIKQRIRIIQREASNRRMIQDVPEADVIVTNPTHFSVALKYDPKTMISPEVIAKGADFMALRIREVAKEHNIPMVENVPLARTLYKTVKVGSVVPRDLYKAVAEVLAFVYKLKQKRKLG